MKSQRFTINEIGPSLNEWYAGTHWTKRNAAKKLWRMLVKSATGGMKPVKKYPVRLEFTFYFGKGRRAFDASNCAATVKLLEDGMVEVGILKSDSPVYVESITMTVKKTTGKTFVDVLVLEDD